MKDVIIYIISSVVVFVFGVKILTYSLNELYNQKINYIFKKYINSDLTALILGIVATAVCQSSNAITIITLALINAQYISFRKGLMIILGSNIGTTVTTFLFSFNFNILIPCFLLLGLYFFLKEDKRNYGFLLIGFGIIFYSLHVLSDNFSIILNEEYIYNFIKKFNSSTFFSFLSGIFFSALIQSSSASIGIVQKLCSENVLIFNSSICFMLGANIGTTLTGFIASLACDKKTKQVATINLLLNIVTAYIFYLFNYNFCSTVNYIGDILHLNIMAKIALSHFIYNTLSVIGFLLLYKIKKVD